MCLGSINAIHGQRPVGAPLIRFPLTRRPRQPGNVHGVGAHSTFAKRMIRGAGGEAEEIVRTPPEADLANERGEGALAMSFGSDFMNNDCFSLGRIRSHRPSLPSKRLGSHQPRCHKCVSHAPERLLLRPPSSLRRPQARMSSAKPCQKSLSSQLDWQVLFRRCQGPNRERVRKVPYGFRLSERCRLARPKATFQLNLSAWSNVRKHVAK